MKIMSDEDKESGCVVGLRKRQWRLRVAALRETREHLAWGALDDALYLVRGADAWDRDSIFI